MHHDSNLIRSQSSLVASYWYASWICLIVAGHIKTLLDRHSLDCDAHHIMTICPLLPNLLHSTQRLHSPSAHCWMQYPPAGILVLFGGTTEPNQLVSDPSQLLNDLWVFNLDTHMWTQLRPAGALPSPRYGHAMTVNGAQVRLWH